MARSEGFLPGVITFKMWLPLLLTVLALQTSGTLGKPNAVPVFLNEAEIRAKLRTIREDQPIKQVIVTVRTSEETNATTYYRIDDTTYFQIDDLNGEISLKSQWDYEAVNSNNWKLTLHITAWDVENDESSISVEVQLENINDNPPVFNDTLESKSIPEDQAVGFRVMKVKVDDADRAANDYFNVTCINGVEDPQDDTCSNFLLVKNFSSNFEWQGNIFLNRTLDYEARKSYSIQLKADDGVHTVVQEFQIKVTDVNDSPPYYVYQNSHVLKEEVAVGTYIDYVSAIDSDEDDKRDIRYELVGDPEALKYFSVSKIGGNITNKRVLDYEDTERALGKEFTLRIKAMELLSENPEMLGNDSTTTVETTISITLEDVNDNCPVWDKPNHTVFLLESVQTGTTLPIQLRLSDKDSVDRYRQFSLRMVDDTGTFGYSSVGTQTPATIFITVNNNKGIDYESPRTEYNLRLEAFGSANQDCSAATMVRIRIVDVNDEIPKFNVPGDSASYSAQVPEDANAGRSVITVEALDSDSGIYGKDGFKFSFVDHPENLFGIDSRSGVVRVNSCPTPGTKPCIDYEWERSYSLSVMVEDNQGNEPTNNAVVDLNIEILNVNDNAPLFLGNYTRRVNEGNTIPDPELLVKAIDRDGDTVTYRLIDSRDSRYWTINAQTGEITALDAIKLEDTFGGIFNFQVEATDGSKTTLANVMIIVVDTNDNYPIFQQVDANDAIQEDYPGGTIVRSVTVMDKDSLTSGNGLVDITIKKGSAGKFTVKNLTHVADEYWVADVYTADDATFDYDAQDQYILILIARDKGILSKTSTSTLTVNIKDINNKDPYFEPPTISVVVSENESPGTTVTVVTAKDRDANAIKEISFGAPIIAYDPAGQTVSNPAQYENLFAISTNGVVTVNQQLDRDIVSIIEFPLVVVDTAADPAQTGTGSLFIRILEFNDQSPQFEYPLYELNILEERGTGTFVTSLLATDEDDQIGSYQLSGNPGNLFAIDLQTGVLTVNGRLDYEAPLFNVTLTAEAYDTGSPRRSATTTVLIHIININDNAPVFTQAIYEKHLLENSTRTDPLIYVSATDGDFGDFGVVRYTANDPYFTVDEISGAVSLVSGTNLDRERFATHVFQVTAYDSPNNASVRRNTTSQVYIILEDINDNCPMFSQTNSYSGSIIETADVGDQVLELFATDLDAGNNSAIHFRIDTSTSDGQEAQRLFSIMSIGELTDSIESGRIEVKRNLRNQSGEYPFVVVASDQNGDNRTGNMCSTRVNVTIRVQEAINDAPEWVLPPTGNFSIDVLESQYKGMLVYDCHARDRNRGKEGIVDYFFRTQGQLNSATQAFRINQVTGVISATIVYDREQLEFYVLTVVAKDQGNPSASSETVLIVNVLDVNDNDPVFPMRDGQTIPYVWDVLEGITAAVVGVIGTISATDSDSDHKNNKVYYKIVAGNDEGLFELGRESGRLMLSDKASNGLDRESKGTYSMDVLAYNYVSDDTVIRYRRKRSTNPSIVTVVVTVQDSNDSPPEFVKSDYYGCVPKSAGFGQSILKVEAVDRDLSGTRYMNFSKVRESTDSFFMIDPSLGIIRNAKLLYNIDSRVPMLRIRADDNDGQSSGRRNTAETDVKIFVTDKDHEVKLEVSQPSSDVHYYQDQLIRAMINTTAKKPIQYVCIREIRDHVDGDGGYSSTSSDVFLSAVYFGSDNEYKLYDSETLHGILVKQLPQYETLHVKSVTVEDEEDDLLSLKDDAVLAIVIIAILLILLAIILFCLACCLIRNSKRKKITKLRAEERRPVEVMHQPAPEVAASVNPVYDNQAFVQDAPDGNEYAVVQKRPPPVEAVGPPIIPVVVLADEEEEPESLPSVHQEPEPVIITEPVMSEEEPVMQPPPENFFTPEPEEEELSLPESDHDEPEPVIETVIETEVAPYEEYHFPAPERSADDEIDVEFGDLDDSPSPRRSPSPPIPPYEEEYRIETDLS